MRPDPFTSRLSPLILLVTLFSWADCFAQRAQPEEAIDSIMRANDVVGLSVAVVREGRIVYAKAFGLSDLETRQPLREEQLFRIASISKSFSATSIMQLVEAGRISLDDDFGSLVGFPIRNPKYPDKVITLRMVLSHTSSINDSEGYFNLDVINPSKNTNWAKCYSDYAPGEKYAYCNLNYNMVGAVIEKVTGERFDSYVRNHILKPLGIYGGYCVDSLDNSLFATLHEFDSAGGFIPAPSAYAPRTEQIRNYTMGYTTPIFSPTGGMKISAQGLAAYMIMHMNYGRSGDVRIISRRSSKTMQKPVAREQGYGLGLTHTDKLIPGLQMTGHTGSAYGLYSTMFFHPRKKFGFVVITNGCRPSYKDGYVTPLKETINVLYESFIGDTK